ncbi:MAG: hypothetical protein CL675_12510 [Bdellovibrionaceae bacterium]|nr:hypothetical protein [Pseudobdellovibrionaceae bacterium]
MALQSESLLGDLKYRLKGSSGSIALFAFRLISGLVLGLTMALIFDEIFGFGTGGFVFVLVMFSGVFLRVSRKWSWVFVLLFDLFCLLVGMLLRMYILIAPGA